MGTGRMGAGRMGTARGAAGKRPRPARLSPADVARLGAAGLRARPLRALLSAIGIAIGIAAMLSVVGISASSRAEVDRTLERLGTNLLTVAPGKTLVGESAQLPESATAMIGRIGPVESASAVATLPAAAYRNDHVPAGQTGSLAVLAVGSGLIETLSATLRAGAWFNRATAEYPAVVLGAGAAKRLDMPGAGLRVWLGGTWFAVVGILDEVPLAEELDSAVLVGWDTARSYLHFDGHPTRVYVRAVESQVDAVRAVLARTANPERPDEVAVSRPADALIAKRATDTALGGLLLGLGAVALLVGGVGVANTMVISVLERRAEVGLRRALGATRRQIRGQFLAESLLLSVLGGAGGVLLGVIVTGVYASLRGWPTMVPAWATAGGVGATLVIGAMAGLYPAVRASRLAPTEALAGP